jgi:hypothetical protein
MANLAPHGPTIRAIRLFQRRESTWELVNRVDWEPPPDRFVADSVPGEVGSVDVIIVDDLEKGAVTTAVVKRLHAKFPGARWYVRAKVLMPDWLRDNPEVKVELLVVGPEVAPQLSPFERWHERQRITSEALRVLGSVPNAKNVVLLSERREVIGKFCRDHDDQARVIWGGSPIVATPIRQIGWTDAFMAALVHYSNGGSRVTDVGNGPITSTHIEQALLAADQHGDVTKPPGTEVTGQSAQATISSHNYSWKVEAEEWRTAMLGIGLLEEPKGDNADPEKRTEQLQVWRASTQLRGYIACIDEKRNVLDEIGRNLRSFSRGTNARHLGIMLQSDPGSGKTHLARCLADAFQFTMLDCDIAQMVHREELFDFFDTVATEQSKDERKPLLVFVDEVNATLDGNAVYGAFLSPLESGVYERHGRRFQLRPCVWLFTGTKVSDAGREEKLSDLISRMSLVEKIDYQSLLDLHPGTSPLAVETRDTVKRKAQLEQVYLGASMINHYFPDVTQVDIELLKRFWALDPRSSPFREIRRIAASLRNVRHGQVTMRNLADRPGSPGVPSKDRLVTLVFQPDEPLTVSKDPIDDDQP